MRIGRTLAPAAAPFQWRTLFFGVCGWMKGQAEIERFADELKSALQVDNCYLLSSGKAAMTVTLQALKRLHPHRDQVLIPAYTCYSVPSAVVRAGLQLVLCDVDPKTLDYDFAKLPEKLNSERLLCVVANHLFGLPADIDRLKATIGDPQVAVLEDAAQALGGEKDGLKLGTQTDVGIFSLGRGKAFTTVEGGIIVTNRSDIAAQIDGIYAQLADYRLIETFILLLYAVALKCLLSPWLFWLPNALPFLRMGETIYDPEFKIKRFSPLQAGLSRNWQARLATFWRERRKVSQQWAATLDEVGQQYFCRQQACPDLIRFPWLLPDAELRRQLLAASDNGGLGMALTYPASVAQIPDLKSRFSTDIYPAAELCAEQVVTLPVHALMSSSDIARLREIIMTAINNKEKS